MAITLADFTKIWASTSPLTPYSFSDANYQEGWNFVGSTPPARQMWDSIQKNNDEKLKYIVDNFLPLSGGTMTGNVSFDMSEGRVQISANQNEAGRLRLLGGSGITNGAQLLLSGKSHSSTAGQFQLGANDGTNAPSLLGKPDGTLTWNGKEVERVNASSTNYIRYVSGLQICFGSVSATNAGTSATFPVSFSANPIITVSAVNSNATAWVTDLSTTGFSAHTSSGAWLWYIAIGKY